MTDANQHSGLDALRRLEARRGWDEADLNDFAIVERLLEQFDATMDCMNYAWTVICNVSEGDWTRQSTEWHKAAARCRDQYHALLNSAEERI